MPIRDLKPFVVQEKWPTFDTWADSGSHDDLSMAVIAGKKLAIDLGGHAKVRVVTIIEQIEWESE